MLISISLDVTPHRSEALDVAAAERDAAAAAMIAILKLPGAYDVRVAGQDAPSTEPATEDAYADFG